MLINIDGIKTNYVEKGEGNTVLLLHGWGANIKLFDNMINHLSKTHKVYALDMPGFGESEEPKEAWNVDNYVDFVIKFIECMNISKLSILGHSFGGRVIIKMVNRDNLKFKIDKLILVDSAGIKPKSQNKKTFRGEMYKFLKKVVSIKLVKKIFPNALDKLKCKFGSEDYRAASPMMRDTLVKVVNEDLTELFPNIKQPTLIIWGDKDEATPISDAYIMNKLIPDSGIVTVENAGHYSFLENHVLVCSVLDSFLGGKND